MVNKKSIKEEYSQTIAGILYQIKNDLIIDHLISSKENHIYDLDIDIDDTLDFIKYDLTDPQSIKTERQDLKKMRARKKEQEKILKLLIKIKASMKSNNE